MNATPEVRVLVVDDQRVVRDGLSLILKMLDDITVVGTAADGAEAVEKAVKLGPDVVLMDITMPRMNGVEATAALRARCPSTGVVVLTTYTDDANVFAALQAGAQGFLTKDAEVDEIRRAVLSVASGHAALDREVQSRLLTALRQGDRVGLPSTRRPGFAPGAAGLRPDGLSEREAEVVAHIAAGLSNAEIAGTLYVSEATVKSHVNHIFTKTGVRDRAQLVAYAFRTRLADPPGSDQSEG